MKYFLIAFCLSISSLTLSQNQELFSTGNRVFDVKSYSTAAGVLILINGDEDQLILSDGTLSGTQPLSIGERWVSVFPSKNGSYVVLGQHSNELGFVDEYGILNRYSGQFGSIHVAKSNVEADELLTVIKDDSNRIVGFSEALEPEQYLVTNDEIMLAVRHAGEILFALQTDLGYSLNLMKEDRSIEFLVEVETEDLVLLKLWETTEDEILYYESYNNQDRRLIRTDKSKEGTIELLTGVIGNPSKTVSDHSVINMNLVDHFSDLLLSSYLDVLNNKKDKVGVLSDDLKSETSKVIRHLESEFYLMNSNERGTELVRLNENGEFELYHELNEGPGSSFPMFLGYSPKLGKHYGHPLPLHIDVNSRDVYSFLTRGTDNYYYLYRLNENEAISLFQLDPEVVPSNLHIHKNNAIWIEKSNDSFKIKSRSLDQIDPPQPEQVEIPKKKMVQIGISQYQVASQGTYDTGFVSLVQEELKNFYSEVDNFGNLIVGAFQLKSERDSYIVFEQSYEEFISDESITLFKINPQQEVMWYRTFHSNYLESVKIEVDSNNDIVLVGAFLKSNASNALELEIAETGVTILKLSGIDGSIIWQKLLINSDSYSFGYDWTHRILDLAIDKRSNIYVGLMYSYLIDMELIDFDLLSLNYENDVLLKLDEEGKWLNTFDLTSSYSEYISGETQLEYIESIDEVEIVQTNKFKRGLGYYTFWVTNVSSEGEIKRRKSYDRKEYVGMRGSTFKSDGKLALTGIYGNDAPQFDFYHITHDSERVGDDSYLAIFNPELGGMEYVLNSDRGSFISHDIASSEDFIFLVGSDSDENLKLAKFSWNGEYLGTKNLRQNVGRNCKDGCYTIEYSEGDLILTGVFKSWNAEYGITPTLNYIPNFAVLRVEDKDWNREEKSFVSAELVIESEEPNSNYVLYPNPTTDKLIVVQDNNRPLKASILGITGQFIKSIQLSGENHSILNVRDLNAGAYFLLLESEQGNETRKFIKLGN
ncbi:MAG TPA: hypothetical protein DDX92_00005 [Flavobacteriales bacterium]|jgi:hypothetical protein|nr:hypothetical protein [Flavobacteriales bacterium]